MENTGRIVVLAASVIVAAILVVAGYSLTSSGKSLLSQGRESVHKTAKDVEESKFNFIDGELWPGSMVKDTIKSVWNEHCDVIVYVSNKVDGPFKYTGDALYTYDNKNFGRIFVPGEDAAAIILTMPKENANGVSTTKTINKAPSDIVYYEDVEQNDHEDTFGTKYGVRTGYDFTKTVKDTRYIPDNIYYKGYVSRDANGSIAMVSFIQQ